MRLITDALVDGYWLDRYGKRGEQFNAEGRPLFSPGFTLEEVPVGTVSFALLMHDPDAIPVCGFSWIHWVCANILEPGIPADTTLESPDFVQGINSLSGSLGAEAPRAQGYGMMAPPNADHEYELRVSALDCVLNLAPGFGGNDLWRASRGHILDTAVVRGFYRTGL